MDEALTESRSTHGNSERSLHRMARYLAGGLISFLAIAGGIYVGFTIAMHKASGEQLIESLNRSYLDIGDPLPDYVFLDPGTRQRLPLAQLIGRRSAVLLFVSHSCGACETMSDYWKRKVLPHLPRDLVLVEVYDDDDWYGDSTRINQKGLFPGSISVTTDREAYKDLDGITATPTLVAIDHLQRVKLVCSGFQRSLDPEILTR